MGGYQQAIRDVIDLIVNEYPDEVTVKRVADLAEAQIQFFQEENERRNNG